MIFCGLVIHYSILVLSMSLAFFFRNSQGLEGGYFTLTEFSRLPRQAFTGVATRWLFVYLLPVVVVSNAPASAVLHGFDARMFVWLAAWTIAIFTVTVLVFNAGLRRYASASS
jgi:ABC-2 type transport system permease protein